LRRAWFISGLGPAKHWSRTVADQFPGVSDPILNASFTEVMGQPFSCEPRPPEEFYQNLLAVGAEPAYMKCVYDCYSNFTTGTSQKSDEVFDNFPGHHG
jgi:NAD(P)H dehydrogenase (quinone)